MSIGTGTAGGYTVPTMLVGDVIDKLRPASQVMASGAQIVPLTTDDTTIARIDSDPVATWRAENATVDASDPVFGRVRLRPKTLAVAVKVSRELLDDSANIELALQKAFIGSFAAEIDRVALEGSGSGSEPTGLTGMTGVNEVTAGAFSNYSEILNAYQECMLDNSQPDGNIILHPSEWRSIQGFVDSELRPLTPPSALTNVVYRPQASITEGQMYLGRWTDYILGIRTALQVEVLKESMASNLQVTFLAWARVDVAVAQPGSFCRIVGISNS